MRELKLELKGLRFKNPGGGDERAYTLAYLGNKMWDWDAVVKGTHLANCWYNQSCLFNLYVKDSVVVREEQVGIYPPPCNSEVPDLNPRGCQKGVCFSHRLYDPTRLKYPLRRAGARGSGQWLRVSWDEALTEIADAMIDVLTTEGNEAVLSFFGSQGMHSGALSAVALQQALALPVPNVTADDADEHPGAAITWGKIVVCGSADNWFYGDMLFIWGGNPSYTHIANFHYIAEARYHGTKVVAITPDYSPSCPFADLWLPINMGTDAALALAMAQVIISSGLYRADFIREQTDLPLLVCADTHKFLTQSQMQRGGRDNVFYVFDERSQKVVEAPWKSLALDGLVPALEGEYQMDTLRGRVRVKPVFAALKERLSEYTPEKAATITGVSPHLIRQLAQEFATAKGVVGITTAQWGKQYHGDLIQRAQILLWALCGHFGRKGATYDTYPMLYLDTRLGYSLRQGAEAFRTAEANDPRFPTWREQGYTDEMILHQYSHEAVSQRGIVNLSLLYHRHAGLMEMTSQNNSWDPHLKRPIEEYLNESLQKGWQVEVPGAQKEPRIIIERGGSFLRRSRTSGHIIRNLLPKLKLLVSLDFRMGSTALYSDIVLPCATSYENQIVRAAGMPQTGYLHSLNKAVDPYGECKSEWEVYCLLAKKIQERAQERGILTFTDSLGRERRLDNLYDQVTVHGLYTEEEEEAVARDFYLNAANVEKMEWEEFKEQGFVPFTGIGQFVQDLACDVHQGEPITPFTYHVGNKRPYPTLTRRMQFYVDHDWFMELGEAFPTHKDIPKMGGDYPLRLTGGHARWSIHSLWKDSPLLLRLQRAGPIMFMSVPDARARGIEDGDQVGVFNDVASFEIMAAVSPAVRPGQVIIYHDWENFQFRLKKHFKSVMPSPLNPIELVGGYGHIRPRAYQFSATPGANDRGTRVEVRSVVETEAR